MSLDNLIDDSSVEPVLTIDLDAVAANYRTVRNLAKGARVGGVIKADGYGCGSLMISKTLVEEGCDLLFVANAAEGATLRTHLEEVEICIFSGYKQTLNSVYEYNSLTPILNSLQDIEAWAEFCTAAGKPLPAGLHIDTGMTRLGLSENDVEDLTRQTNLLRSLSLKLVMSHLACADQPDNEMNGKQLSLFNRLSALFPGVSKSLANSAGIFLGADYHFDVVRPGIVLYGGLAAETGSPALEPVAHLQAPVLQVHEIAENTSIGYGATYKVNRPSRIAIVGLGYADGYLRSLSNLGYGFLAGQKVPIAGRVSMDLTAFDVTDLAPEKCRPGDWIELLGENVSVDEVGRAAGTFGYEVLTSLGHRYNWRYMRNGSVV